MQSDHNLDVKHKGYKTSLWWTS